MGSEDGSWELGVHRDERESVDELPDEFELGLDGRGPDGSDLDRFRFGDGGLHLRSRSG